MSMGMGTERIWAWGMDDGDTETWGRVPKYCACYSVLSPTRTVCFLTLSWYGDGREYNLVWSSTVHLLSKRAAAGRGKSPTLIASFFISS